MARNSELRQPPSGSPATTGRFALLRSRSLVTTAAIFAIVAAAAFLAVYQLAGSGGGKAHPEPAYLTAELGAPQRSASLVRKPAPGLQVAIRADGGFAVEHRRAGVTLDPKENTAGSW